MSSIKEAIVSQIQFLIVNQARLSQSCPQSCLQSCLQSSDQPCSVSNPDPNPQSDAFCINPLALSSDQPMISSCSSDSIFENHMLHTVLSGHPGSGKTTVAMILAHIWSSLGLIKNNTPTPDPNLELTKLSIELLQAKTQKKQHAADLLGGIDKVSIASQRTRILRDSVDFRARPYPSRNRLNRLHQELDNHMNELAQVQDELCKIYGQYESEIFGPDPLVPNPEPEDPYLNADPIFVIADRSTLVGEFIGQTAIKTKAILEKARGGVLFIDEAYSLVNPDSSRDFGHECLAMMIEYMSKYPDELIIIFAGYRDKLNETIFKSQPGLARRCGQTFNIEKYSPNGLARIFQQQLTKYHWVLDPNVNVGRFFEQHIALFPDSGGSTEKFVMYCKFVYSELIFRRIISDPQYAQTNLITSDILQLALTRYRQHNFTLEETPPPFGMFI